MAAQPEFNEAQLTGWATERQDRNRHHYYNLGRCLCTRGPATTGYVTTLESATSPSSTGCCADCLRLLGLPAAAGQVRKEPAPLARPARTYAPGELRPGAKAEVTRGKHARLVGTLQHEEAGLPGFWRLVPNGSTKPLVFSTEQLKLLT